MLLGRGLSGSVGEGHGVSSRLFANKMEVSYVLRRLFLIFFWCARYLRVVCVRVRALLITMG